MDPSDRRLWLLAIIGSSGHACGPARLHKYGLLASKIVLADDPPYADWECRDFGAYSPLLGADARYLVAEGLAEVRATGGLDDLLRYSPSRRGRGALGAFGRGRGGLIRKIRVLTGHYNGGPLDDLLADSYSLFPEHAAGSKIRGRARRSFLMRDVLPGARFALPYTGRTVGLSSITSTAEVNQFPHGDGEARRNLARLIGLPGVPPIDAAAFDEDPVLYECGPLVSGPELVEIVEDCG